MGKKPAEIEREIEHRRQELSVRRRQIESRIRSDAGDARSAVKDEISAQAAKTKLEESVDKHPMSTVLAAFGTGVLLGTVAPGTSGNNRNDYPMIGAMGVSGRGRQQQGDDGGFLNGLLGTVTGPLGNTIQDELRMTVREFFGRESVGSESGGSDYADRSEHDRSSDNSDGRRSDSDLRDGGEDRLKEFYDRAQQQRDDVAR